MIFNKLEELSSNLPFPLSAAIIMHLKKNRNTFVEKWIPSCGEFCMVLLNQLFERYLKVQISICKNLISHKISFEHHKSINCDLAF